jgi:hypothetical protein
LFFFSDFPDFLALNRFYFLSIWVLMYFPNVFLAELQTLSGCTVYTHLTVNIKLLKSISALSNPAWVALLAEAQALHSITGGCSARGG